MGVPVQTHSHDVLVPVHETPESMPPPVRTLFQSAEVCNYDSLILGPFNLMQLLF
jgi:hypothetical protein